MKKTIAFLLALMLALALPLTAYAVELPANKVSITVQPVDYNAARTGIAQPVTKSYVSNERFALLVSITIPRYLGTDNMELVIEPKGCTIEAGEINLAGGDFLLFGTVISNASIKIIAKDNAADQAATPEEYLRAVYGDRTVSATATLGAAATTTQVPGIPKTGGREDIAWIGLCFLLMAVCWAVIVYNGIGIWAYLRDKRRQRHA